MANGSRRQPGWADLYTAHLRQSYAPSTVRRFLAVVRAFQRMLAAEGLDAGPLAVPVALPGLPRPKKSSRGQESQPEVGQLGPDLSPKDVRDHAIWALHRVEGLRPGQIRALDCYDVDLDAGMVRVTNRSGKPKSILLSASTLALVRRWLAVRRVMGPKDEAVFGSLHWTAGRSEPGGRLSCRGICQIMRRMKTR